MVHLPRVDADEPEEEMPRQPERDGDLGVHYGRRVGGDVDAVDLRPVDLALEVRGDPHRPQRALPSQDGVGVEHRCGLMGDRKSTL